MISFSIKDSQFSSNSAYDGFGIYIEGEDAGTTFDIFNNTFNDNLNFGPSSEDDVNLSIRGVIATEIHTITDDVTKQNVFNFERSLIKTKKLVYIDHYGIRIPTNPFSELNDFTYSLDFSNSNIFSESNDFFPSEKFSKSNMFSYSQSFSSSEKFSFSEYFIKSDAFTESKGFSNSNEFSKSFAFIESNKFTESSDFSESNKFTLSSKFSGTFGFSKLEAFSLSQTLISHTLSLNNGSSEPTTESQSEEPTTESQSEEQTTESQSEEQTTESQSEEQTTESQSEEQTIIFLFICFFSHYCSYNLFLFFTVILVNYIKVIKYLLLILVKN